MTENGPQLVTFQSKCLIESAVGLFFLGKISLGYQFHFHQNLWWNRPLDCFFFGQDMLRLFSINQIVHLIVFLGWLPKYNSINWHYGDRATAARENSFNGALGYCVTIAFGKWLKDKSADDPLDQGIVNLPLLRGSVQARIKDIKQTIKRIKWN